jgi:hypothetical protein
MDGRRRQKFRQCLSTDALENFRRKFLLSQKSNDLVRLPFRSIIINHFLVNLAVLVRMALDDIRIQFHDKNSKEKSNFQITANFFGKFLNNIFENLKKNPEIIKKIRKFKKKIPKSQIISLVCKIIQIFFCIYICISATVTVLFRCKFSNFLQINVHIFQKTVN